MRGTIPHFSQAQASRAGGVVGESFPVILSGWVDGARSFPWGHGPFESCCVDQSPRHIFERATLHHAQLVVEPFSIFRVHLRELLDQIEENPFSHLPSGKAG